MLKAHEEVCSAIGSGDGDAAEAAMRRHMGDSLVYLERHYRSVMDERLSWEMFGA